VNISVLHGINVDLAVASFDTTEAIGVGRVGRHLGDGVKRGAAEIVGTGVIGGIIDTLLVRAVGVTIDGRRLSSSTSSALFRSAKRVVEQA